MLESYIGGVWRPYKNWGVFAGLNYDKGDLEFSSTNVDITFWGPTVGLEFRF